MKEIENGKWVLYNEDDVEEYIKMLGDYTHRGEKDFSNCIVFDVSDNNPYTKDYTVCGVDEMSRELSDRLDDTKEVTVSEPMTFSGKEEKGDIEWVVTLDRKRTMENLLRELGLPFPLVKHIMENDKGQ